MSQYTSEQSVRQISENNNDKLSKNKLQWSGLQFFSHSPSQTINP